MASNQEHAILDLGIDELQFTSNDYKSTTNQVNNIIKHLSKGLESVKLHWDTCVSLIVLLRSNCRGGTTNFFLFYCTVLTWFLNSGILI